MQTTDNPVAIFVADLHLSLKAPIWRSIEEDWLTVTKRYLDEVSILQAAYDCPVICAGDVFHLWNSMPEIINFAMENLPQRFYAIPGQHDLPYHNMKLIKKSAYWTLVKSGHIHHLEGGTNHRIIIPNFRLSCFAYGKKITPPTVTGPKLLNIAVAHQYNWIKRKSYTTANPENEVNRKRKELLEYDLVVFGDNHKSFSIGLGNKKPYPVVWNCGGFMRRQSDEIEHNPRLGLLYKDGTFGPYYLDTVKDKALPITKTLSNIENRDMFGFFDELEALGDSAFNFRLAIDKFFKNSKTRIVKSEVRRIIEQAMEEAR